MSNRKDEFELRIVTIDYYLAKPIPGLDATHSAFLSAPVDKVGDARADITAPHTHTKDIPSSKSRHPPP